MQLICRKSLEFISMLFGGQRVAMKTRPNKPLQRTFAFGARR